MSRGARLEGGRGGRASGRRVERRIGRAGRGEDAPEDEARFLPPLLVLVGLSRPSPPLALAPSYPLAHANPSSSSSSPPSSRADGGAASARFCAVTRAERKSVTGRERRSASKTSGPARVEEEGGGESVTRDSAGCVTGSQRSPIDSRERSTHVVHQHLPEPLHRVAQRRPWRLARRARRARRRHLAARGPCSACARGQPPSLIVLERARGPGDARCSPHRRRRRRRLLPTPTLAAMLDERERALDRLGVARACRARGGSAARLGDVGDEGERAVAGEEGGEVAVGRAVSGRGRAWEVR